MKPRIVKRDGRLSIDNKLPKKADTATVELWSRALLFCYRKNLKGLACLPRNGRLFRENFLWAESTPGTTDHRIRRKFLETFPEVTRREWLEGVWIPQEEDPRKSKGMVERLNDGSSPQADPKFIKNKTIKM